MMLRKRVWDITREEYASVDENATLAEVVIALRESRKKQPDNAVVLVFAKDGRFLGLLSMWNLLQGMGPHLLKSAMLDGDEVNWDLAFRDACRSCVDFRITEFMQKDVPILKPNDLLARLLEVFLHYRRSKGVVEEGGKIIGVVTVADLITEIGRNFKI